MDSRRRACLSMWIDYSHIYILGWVGWRNSVDESELSWGGWWSEKGVNSVVWDEWMDGIPNIYWYGWWLATPFFFSCHSKSNIESPWKSSFISDQGAGMEYCCITCTWRARYELQRMCCGTGSGSSWFGCFCLVVCGWWWFMVFVFFLLKYEVYPKVR